MWLLIAEAGIALALLLFIVWWTMSGRSRHGRGGTAKEEKPGDVRNDVRSDGRGDGPAP
jgi:hypothetical protein